MSYLQSMLRAVFVVLAGTSLAAAREPSLTENVSASDWLVSLIEEIDVPALEGGPLVEVRATPGLEVKAGELLARIEDGQARIELEIAEREYEAARLKAESEVDIEFARKSEQVALFNYQTALEANRSHTRAVVETELKSLQFEWERSKLQIAQAELAHRTEQQNVGIRRGKLHSAQDSVRRRQITAPVAGLVVQVNRQSGEWVGPGDAIVQLVRLDRLRVKGALNAGEYLPAELMDRPARVLVSLARGRAEVFTGRVTFVSPKEEADGKFQVWIDVQNRQEQGRWLLTAGKKADVEIDLRSAPATSAIRPLPPVK